MYPPSLSFFLSHVPAEKIAGKGVQFALTILRQARHSSLSPILVTYSPYSLYNSPLFPQRLFLPIA